MFTHKSKVYSLVANRLPLYCLTSGCLSRRPKVSLVHNSHFQFAFRTNMTSESDQTSSISHVLETCLYVRSVDESCEFYKSLLGKDPFNKSVS